MRTIGKYTITRKIGSGGMGVVYAAHDPTTNRAVALKVLADDDADRTDIRRFEREAWAAAQVKHPNTVAVLDAGEADGKPFLVMELVDGQTVGQLIDRRGPLPWATATKIVIAACKGLAAVHAAGLVHRDVKPANVMISADGVIKLADFGLAKMANRTTRSLTGAGTVGTPHFMSPEQCHNEPVDGRTDIYALGATYFVLLTGTTPYTGDHELQVMYAHCNEPTPDPRRVLPEIPPGCSAVVRKAMAKSPADRHPTALALQAALEGLLARNGAEGDPSVEHAALQLPPETIPSGPVVPRGWLRDHRVTRRRVLLALPAAGLIGVTAAIVWPRFGDKVKDITKTPVPPAILVPVRQVGERVAGVAVTDDGRWLAVGLTDGDGAAGGVKLFDRSKGRAPEEWWRLRDDAVRGVAFSPDGSLLAVGRLAAGRLVVWNTGDGTEVAFGSGDVPGNLLGLAFSPDGRRLAAAIDPRDENADGLVRVWDVRTKALHRDLKHRKEGGRTVAFAPDGKTLAVGMGFTAAGRAPEVDVWDAESGLLLKQLPTFQTGNGPAVAFARSKPLLAVAERETVRFYLPMSFTETERAVATNGDPAGVALSPDGTVWALAVGSDVTVRPVAPAVDQAWAKSLPGPEGHTPALAFTADGRALIAGSHDKCVYEWDVPVS